jgi:hypothetical protein
MLVVDNHVQCAYMQKRKYTETRLTPLPPARSNPEGKSTLKCVKKDLRNIITVVHYFGFCDQFILWAQFALITPLNSYLSWFKKNKVNCSLQVSLNSFMHNIRLLYLN